MSVSRASVLREVLEQARVCGWSDRRVREEYDGRIARLVAHGLLEAAAPPAPSTQLDLFAPPPAKGKTRP